MDNIQINSNILETARARILQFIELQNIKPSEFLDKTGLKKGFVDKSHSDSGLTDQNMSKILDAYPNISAVWLITGRGSMLTDVHADTSVAGENLLAQTPASAPATAIEAHTATKAPRMGNYASDRIIEEKQKAYERQIADMKEELMNAYMKIGYLTAEKEELKAALDTNTNSTSHVEDADDAPARKVAGE